MKKILSASMMCANYGHLETEMKDLEAAGVDMLHIDIMDGSFVPNFGMGLQDAQYLCKNSSIPCDIHLMVNNPGQYVKLFAGIGAKIIYVHYEADKHITRTLQAIIDAGVKTGIAINPGTSFEMIQDILPLIDYVMVMTVNPGFAGQTYLPFVDTKIKKLAAHKDEYNYKIIIDGACSVDKVKSLNHLADGFILGTSALFNQDVDYLEAISRLR